MRSYLGIVLICVICSGCAKTTKTSVSVYLEKNLWVETDIGDQSDAKARVEYCIEQRYE